MGWELLEGIRNTSKKIVRSWKGSGIFSKNLGALGRDQEYFQKVWELLEGIRNISKNLGALGRDQDSGIFQKIWELLEGIRNIKKNWELLLGIRNFSKNIVELSVEIRNIPKTLRGGRSWLGSGIFPKNFID